MLHKNFQIILSLFSMFVLMIGFQNCGGSLESGEQRRVLGSNEDTPKFEVAPDFGSNDVNIRIPDEMKSGLGGKIEWFFIDQEGRRSDFVTTEEELNIFNANITRLSKGQIFAKLPNSSEYIEYQVIAPKVDNSTESNTENTQRPTLPSRREASLRPGLPDEIIEIRRLKPPPPKTTVTTPANNNSRNNDNNNNNGFGGLGGR